MTGTANPDATQTLKKHNLSGGEMSRPSIEIEINVYRSMACRRPCRHGKRACRPFSKMATYSDM